MDILSGEGWEDIPVRHSSEDEEDSGVMQRLFGTSRGGRSRKASLLGPSERRQPCPHAECRFRVVLGSRGMAEQVFVVFKSPSLW